MDPIQRLEARRVAGRVRIPAPEARAVDRRDPGPIGTLERRGRFVAQPRLLVGAQQPSINNKVQRLGAAFSAIWLSSCFVFQNCFRNRFEFSIHALLTLDFCFESLVPDHAGYSFYYCAAGFWLVFLTYHHLPLQPSRVRPAETMATA